MPTAYKKRSDSQRIAFLGGVLSSVASLAWLLHFNVCGTSGCTDPRWGEYAQVQGVPVAFCAALMYFAYAFLCTADVRHQLKIIPLLGGLISGGHLYFSWIQFGVLHAFCLLCIFIAMCGFSIGILSILQTGVKGLAFLIPATLTIVFSLFYFHSNVDSRSSPDPMIQFTGPTIYRPNKPAAVEVSITQRIINGKRHGPPNANVRVDVFIDFQCRSCKQLEIEVWPGVLKALGEKGAMISVEYRMFVLEGHPLGWQAAFASLGAASDNYFYEAKHQLFANQEKWLKNGDVNGSMEFKLQQRAPAYMSDPILSACKQVIRMDVAEGALLGVTSSPTVVVRSGSIKKVIKGLSTPIDYANAIMEFQKLAR